MKKHLKTTIIVILSVLLLFAVLINIALIASRRTKSSDTSYRDVQTKDYAMETTAADYVDYDIENEFEYEAADEYSGTNGLIDNDVRDIQADSRMLVRRVYYTIETTDFEGVIDNIKTQVAELNGYYENSSISGTGNNRNFRNATLVVRIPSSNLDSIVSTLPSIATVISSSETTEDVTMNYVDTEARIESLRVEQETLNNLLANAEDLDTIIILQNELTSVRYQIESYESQLRTLGNQVQYATLTIVINEVIEETPVVEIETLREKTFSEKLKESFDESVENLKIDFMDSMIDFMAALPGLIIFLIIAAIVTVVIVVIIKITKKKMKTGAKIANNEVKKDDSVENS